MVQLCITFGSFVALIGQLLQLLLSERRQKLKGQSHISGPREDYIVRIILYVVGFISDEQRPAIA